MREREIMKNMKQQDENKEQNWERTIKKKEEIWDEIRNKNKSKVLTNEEKEKGKKREATGGTRKEGKMVNDYKWKRRERERKVIATREENIENKIKRECKEDFGRGRKRETKGEWNTGMGGIAKKDREKKE